MESMVIIRTKGNEGFAMKELGPVSILVTPLHDTHMTYRCLHKNLRSGIHIFECIRLHYSICIKCLRPGNTQSLWVDHFFTFLRWTHRNKFWILLIPLLLPLFLNKMVNFGLDIGLKAPISLITCSVIIPKWK